MIKKLLLPSLLLSLAGFGCGNSGEETTSTARAQTVTIGSEMDVIETDTERTDYNPTYTREECTLNEVQFDGGEYTLDEEGYERLDVLASCHKAGEIGQLLVVGVDDPDMDDDRRHHIAERRAMLVVDYLLDAGLDEPDVRFESRQQAAGFVLTWPDQQIAITDDANRG